MASVTFPPGVSVVGPVKPSAGKNKLVLSFDGSTLNPTVYLSLGVSEDGVTFTEVAPPEPYAAPPVDRQGNPLVPATTVYEASLGTTASGPILTTANTRVQLTVDNQTGASWTVASWSVVAI